MGRPVFALRVQAEPGAPGGPSVYQCLRGWLKRGLRDFGLRCLDIYQEPEPEMEMPMAINLNDAEPQGTRTLIPAGVYPLKITLKRGGAGPDGDLMLAKNLRSLMLKLEYTVVGGDYAGKKILDWITVDFDETDDPNINLPTV